MNEQHGTHNGQGQHSVLILFVQWQHAQEQVGRGLCAGQFICSFQKQPILEHPADFSEAGRCKHLGINGGLISGRQTVEPIHD